MVCIMAFSLYAALHMLKCHINDMLCYKMLSFDIYSEMIAKIITVLINFANTSTDITKLQIWVGTHLNFSYDSTKSWQCQPTDKVINSFLFNVVGCPWILPLQMII